MHFVSSTNDLREYLDLAAAKNINFSNISTDTRSISKDALFIAIKGPNFDGNKFIDQAFDNGAVAVLTSDTQYKNNTNPACIYVLSVKEALIQIATRICDEFKGKKILITGSNGKTTCTFLLSNSLPNCSSTIGNFNNEIGLPLSVMQADRDSEYLVLEAGAGKPGDIAILSEIVKPHLGLITSISESHTEFLGNLEGVFNEKTSMVKFIQKGGDLIIGTEFEEGHPLNAKLKSLQELSSKKNNIFINLVELNLRFFSEVETDPLRATDSYDYWKECVVNFSKYMTNMQFKYWKPWGEDEFYESYFDSNLIGLHNIKNIILVSRCLETLEVYDEDLKAILVSPIIKSLNRLEHLSWINGSHLINDSYNANPSSVKAAIELLCLASRKKFRRRIFVLGDMLELKNPIESHVEVGNFIIQSALEAWQNGIDSSIGAINKDHPNVSESVYSKFQDAYIDVLITFGDFAEKVAQTVREKSLYKNVVECYVFESKTGEKKLIKFLKDFIEKDDIVIVKGSRGMKMERFI